MNKKNSQKKPKIPSNPKNKTSTVQKVSALASMSNTTTIKSYSLSVFELFPDYRELLERAIQLIPIEDLPLYLHVPDYCLELIEKRLKKGK